ncbi:hypothetical protein [Phenylobacterium immobile]|uniref:hypothetical protein n=1 Tax=Phenylobacterium immobile TaxID=21 RepID=UPI000B87DB69|nr:hypothetical protein [Phenylobacterium immobile]
MASIDSRRLRRDGFFEPPINHTRVTCQIISPDAFELDVDLAWDSERSEILIGTPNLAPDRRTAVTVGRRDPSRGGAYYFVCPLSAERCEKLYFAGGGWGSRKAKGLTYSSQNGSLSDRYGHTARRLTAELEGAGGRPLPSPERRAWIEGRLERLGRRLDGMVRRRSPSHFAPVGANADLLILSKPAERQDALRGPSLSTLRALERAEALSDEHDDTIQWLYRRGGDFETRLDDVAWAEGLARLAPDYVENYPRISLRALAQHGLLRPGHRRGVQLDWSGLDCGLDHCNLLLDLREDGRWFAGFEIFIDGRLVDQALRLIDTVDGPAFRCPLSGQLTDTLVFRAGGFAAANALGATRRPGRA